MIVDFGERRVAYHHFDGSLQAYVVEFPVFVNFM
jgi:hypothetical protein